MLATPLRDKTEGKFQDSPRLSCYYPSAQGWAASKIPVVPGGWGQQGSRERRARGRGEGEGRPQFFLFQNASQLISASEPPEREKPPVGCKGRQGDCVQ